MKNKILSAIVVLFAIVVSPLVANEIIRDGNFEESFAQWSHESAFDGAISMDNADFIAGKQSLQIDSKEENKKVSTVSQELKVSPRASYVIEGSIKTTQLKNGQGAILRISQNGKVLAETAPLSSSDIWTEFKLPFTTVDTDKAQLSISFGGVNGQAHFDQIRIKTVAENVSSLSSTPKPSRANIAIACPYKLSSKPNYSLCSDPEDNVQLTDGKNTVGYFWTQKSTVGWQGCRFVTITVDLGADRPISGFALNTAGGKAGVNLPKNILVTASVDGKNACVVGDIVQMLDQPRPSQDTGYTTFTYRTTNVRTHGRYLSFTVFLKGNYFFLDEIEIYEGEKDFLKQAYSNIIKNTEHLGIPTEYLIKTGCITRFFDDIEQIRKRLDTSKMAQDLKVPIRKNLDAISAQVKDFSISDITKFRAVFPFNELHAKILACYGQILAQEAFPVLSVWHSHRYAPLALLEIPQKETPSLSLDMMQNEYRSEAFNLTNASEKPIEVSFRLKNLPECVEVRQLEYVDTREEKIVATALTPVKSVEEIHKKIWILWLSSYKEKSYKTIIPAGMTRQIWLTFNPKDTKAGSYVGKIEIEAGEFRNSLPFTLRISQLRFPDKTSLNAAVWDYAASNSYGINAKNKEKVIADLRSHFVNVPIANARQAAIPKASDIDASGHLTKALDFSAFDEWLKIWPDAAHYHIFINVTEGKSDFAGIKFGTLAFNTAVSEWAKAWDAHIQALGLSKGKVQMHFLDEPNQAKEFQILEKWIDAFRSGNKMIYIFNDPTNLDKKNNMDFAPAALDKCNVICPLLAQFLSYPVSVRQFLENYKKNDDNELWVYMCSGPNRHFDPSYFRMQAWYAFQFGLSGSCFWNYSDSRGNPWNEYAALGSESFAMVYLDDDGPISTRQWEAFREGIEDYEYLQILKEKLKSVVSNNSVGEGSLSPENIAKNTLEKLELITLRNFGIEWNAKNPCRVADEGRLQVLEILDKLNSKEKE